jgi:hyperosmotically inducible protein
MPTNVDEGVVRRPPGLMFRVGAINPGIGFGQPHKPVRIGMELAISFSTNGITQINGSVATRYPRRDLKEQSKGYRMRYSALMLGFLAVVLMNGCKKDQTESRQSKATVEADNTGRNVRDRGGDTKTPGDQAENEGDRTITQNIRRSLTSDDSLSTNAKNVKIISRDGVVTLRGPVKSQEEKTKIEEKAKQVAGVKSVDNQLEIAS